jgi:hypothetical protein
MNKPPQPEKGSRTRMLPQVVRRQCFGLLACLPRGTINRGSYFVRHGEDPACVLFGYPKKHQLTAYLKLSRWISASGSEESELSGI